ncbi:MAG: hypothetical protein WB784_00805 [Rhodanobacteraceae bacterium]
MDNEKTHTHLMSWSIFLKVSLETIRKRLPAANALAPACIRADRHARHGSRQHPAFRWLVRPEQAA